MGAFLPNDASRMAQKFSPTQKGDLKLLDFSGGRCCLFGHSQPVFSFFVFPSLQSLIANASLHSEVQGLIKSVSTRIERKLGDRGADKS